MIRRTPATVGRTTWLVLGLALLAFSSPATAQSGTRVDLVPSVAFFNPTANVVDEGGATAKFTGGAGPGARLSIWLNDNVAIEASGHFMASSLDGEIQGLPAGSIDATMFYGSAQIAVALGAQKRFMLHGGLGMQGTNYDELIEGGNILTGVLGFGGWAPLGETVALRADVDMHAHTTYYDFGGVQTEELMQYDMVFSVGLQFSPGGR